MAGSALLSGATMYANKRQAEEMGRAQAAQAIQASNFQQAALNSQAIDQSREATQKATAADMDAAKLASSARVSAGEAGIGGAGVNRLLGEIGRQASDQQAVLDNNSRSALSIINQNKDMTESRLNSQLEQIDRATEGPGLLSALLTIGQGALSGYSMGTSLMGAGGTTANLSTMFTDPNNFMLPTAQASVNNMKKTGYSSAYDKMMRDLITGN